MRLETPSGKLFEMRLFYLYRKDDTVVGKTHSFLAPLREIDRTGTPYYHGFLTTYHIRQPDLPELWCIDVWFGRNRRLVVYIPRGWPLFPVKAGMFSRNSEE